MEVIIIGSGTGVPRLRRGSPAVGVKAGENFILLDIGSGTLRAMLHYDLNFNNIDILCLSHLHPDHVGDLVPFFFASRYSLGYTRKKPFWLLAAQGFSEFQEKLQSVWGEWVEPPKGLMRLQELTGDRDNFTSQWCDHHNCAGQPHCQQPGLSSGIRRSGHGLFRRYRLERFSH